MTTIVNNPAPKENSNGGGSIIIAVVVLILAAIFIYYGIPALRRMGTPQVTVPTEINVPDQIDVNVTE